jgi:hypothetical protein
MASKRMTLDQADSARRRAVTMLENFGDEAGAAEFDAMTPEEYADHKGIELVNANPSHRTRATRARQHSKSRRRVRDMAKSKRVEELEDTISDIYETYQNSGETRAAMTEALEQIGTLCTEAMPSLEDEDEGDGDEEEDE